MLPRMHWGNLAAIFFDTGEVILQDNDFVYSIYEDAQKIVSKYLLTALRLLKE